MTKFGYDFGSYDVPLFKEVIVDQLTGIALQKHIQSRAMHSVAPSDLELFVEDINEDLNALSPRTIAGLGVTTAQLQRWLQLNRIE